MMFDLKLLLQPTINEINLAQEKVAKQCQLDNIEPNQHVYYFYLLQLERGIKDWLTMQEFKRTGKE